MTRAGVECEMRRTLPATLQAAEEFFVDFKQKSQLLYTSKSHFTAELLVREALTNAIVHGCHEDPSKQVRCVLRLTSRRLVIAVEDDGDGFDWRAASCNLAGASDYSGRGLEILRKYGSRVRFKERGNGVTIVKRFTEES
jgi:serine/threonine-protein kinase RsbW